MGSRYLSIKLVPNNKAMNVQFFVTWRSTRSWTVGPWGNKLLSQTMSTLFRRLVKASIPRNKGRTESSDSCNRDSPLHYRPGRGNYALSAWIATDTSQDLTVGLLLLWFNAEFMSHSFVRKKLTTPSHTNHMFYHTIVSSLSTLVPNPATILQRIRCNRLCSALLPARREKDE